MPMPEFAPQTDADAISHAFFSHAAYLETYQPEPIPDTEATRHFSPVSLADWMRLAEKAGVPAVPAHRVAEINRVDWLRFDTPGEHQERLNAAIDKIEAAASPNAMFRFDFCAPFDIKFSISEGESAWREDFNVLSFDDPRAFDLLFEYPRERVPVFKRPWLKTTTVDGYPVEYRVYVNDGEIRGISNYYPQRDLPVNERQLEQVAAMADRLIQELRQETPFLWNNSPMLESFLRHGNPNDIHCTIDFIVAGSGAVLFLEGGPPHELGAHHCCFKPNQIEGTALSDRNNAPV